ncbi:MAG: hypothetical protein HC777_03865 [Hyphomonadaceae bacterium]|nr:hypothetical protein [Hyphomonadaceae bacterium]
MIGEKAIDSYWSQAPVVSQKRQLALILARDDYGSEKIFTTPFHHCEKQ